MNYIAVLLVFGSIVALTTADIPPVFQCSPVNCTEDCPVNNDAKPCPECSCEPQILNRRRRGAECSMPKCDSPCKITYAEGSCPTCDCEDGGAGEGNPPQVQCDSGKCDYTRCWMDYSVKPCPSCKCNEPSKPANEECGRVKCSDNCYIDYSTPCPSCKCDNAAPSKNSFSMASASASA